MVQVHLWVKRPWPANKTWSSNHMFRSFSLQHFLFKFPSSIMWNRQKMNYHWVLIEVSSIINPWVGCRISPGIFFSCPGEFFSWSVLFSVPCIYPATSLPCCMLFAAFWSWNLSFCVLFAAFWSWTFHVACYLQHYGAGTFYFACYLPHLGAGTFYLSCCLPHLRAGTFHFACYL